MDTTVPPSPWQSPCQRRESIQEEQDMEMDMVMSSPILDRVPTDAFSRTHTRASGAPPPLPPHYHLTVLSSGPPSQAQQYQAALGHIVSPLAPLVSVTTGQPHPAFPSTLLQYHLLTHPELDQLSVHYHQTEPASEHSFRYPCKIPGWLPASEARRESASGTRRGSEGRRGNRGVKLTLDTKRRRFGRFIGLRGCESPDISEERREMEERMEREWQRGLEKRREEEGMREKMWRGSW
jgi:hypothetical protein